MTDNIPQNKDLQEVQDAIKLANSQLEQAKLNNNPELVNEITGDLDALNNIFTAAEAQLIDAKDKDKQDSLNFLASERRMAGKKRSEYLDEIGGLANANEEQLKTYASMSSDPPTTNSEIHSHLARVLDAPLDKVDVDTGLDGKNRTNLSFLQTPEEKLQYLKERFPNGVEQINITGTPAYALKKQDGGWLMADELGTSVRDVTADIVGTAIPAIVGAGTAVAAARLGLKNPSVVANVAQSGTGFVQDVFARKALGLDPKLGDAAMARTGEALTGMAIDQASRLLIQPLAKRIGEPLKNELAKKVDEARTLLKEKGIETTAPISYLFGTRPLQKQKQLMGRMEDAWVGTGPTRAAQKTVDALSTFKESITGVPTNVYGSAMDVLKTESDNLADLVAKSNVDAGNVVKSVLNKRLMDTSVESADREMIGTGIRGQLENARTQLKQIKDSAYGDFYVKAEGLTMTPAEVARHLEEGAKMDSKQFKNTGIDRLVEEYKAKQGDALEAIRLRDDPAIVKTPEVLEQIRKLSESGAVLSASEVDDVIKMAKETIPEGGSFATGNTPLVVAEGASSNLRNIQRSRYAEKGIAEQWDSATAAYDEALAGSRGLNAKILKTKLGEPTMTATTVVDSTLADPQYIRDVIDLASATDPAAGQQVRESLKKAYLTKIGLVTNAATKPESLDFDEKIVNTLWGVDPTGKANPLLGNNMVDKLKDLQKSFADKKLNMSNIKAEDVDELFLSLNDNEKLQIKERIIKSAMAKQEQEDFANNELIKIAKSGNFDALDGDNFAKAMYNAKVSDVASVMKRMPAAQKASLQGDFVAQLMRDLPSTTTATGGKRIFDGGKFLKMLEGQDGKIIEGRIKTVMGKEFFDTFKAAATMADVNHIPLQNLSDPAVKASLSEDRLKLFGVGNILGWGRDRFMSGAHGLNILVPFWKTMAKDVGPEQTAKNFKNFYNTAISGRIGITALAHAGRNDPDFKQNINDFLYGRSQEDAGYANRMRANIPSQPK